MILPKGIARGSLRDRSWSQGLHFPDMRAASVALRLGFPRKCGKAGRLSHQPCVLLLSFPPDAGLSEAAWPTRPIRPPGNPDNLFPSTGGTIDGLMAVAPGRRNKGYGRLSG